MTPEALKKIMLEKALTDSVERASFVHGFRTAEKIYTQGENMSISNSCSDERPCIPCYTDNGLCDAKKIQVKVKQLHPKAKMPTYGSDGAACFDLYAADISSEHNGHMCICSTGLAFEIPAGYEMQIRPRSGMFRKQGIMAFDGTIDSDYRGVVDVLLYQVVLDGDAPQVGDKIAQAKIAPVQQASFVSVSELSETARGANGFGSTGK